VAQALHVTQPAVSKQIAEIEAALSTPVIYRERNRLFLTEVGQRLAVHAQAVIQQLRSAELELDVLSLGGSGHLRIGSVTSLAPTLLADAIGQFKRVAPAVSLAVSEGHFVGMRPLLERGDIDVAIARIWQPESLDGIEQLMLSSDPLVVVCGREHPLARRRRPAWAEALASPWILPARHSVAQRAIEAFWAQNGLPMPTDVIEAQSLLLSLALMQRMPYLGIFPESLALTQAARGDLAVLDLRLDGVLAEARCFWRTGQKTRNSALAPFLECLRAAGRPR
jgi:DNA-binding transcriptional LysR family regulator